VGSKIRDKLSVTKTAMRNFDMVYQGTKQYGIKGQYEINISNNTAEASKKSNVNMNTNTAGEYQIVTQQGAWLLSGVATRITV
jgi:hypothetical protein